MQQQQLQQQNSISPFLSRYTYAIIALTLLVGICIGYFIQAYRVANNDVAKSKIHVVQLLISDGENTKTWNNVALEEGDSVAKILTRVADIEKLELTWNGSGKDETLASLLAKSSENGMWTYYINDTNPLPTIGRYFPKNGDVLSLIYTNKKL